MQKQATNQRKKRLPIQGLDADTKERGRKSELCAQRYIMYGG